MELFEFKFYRSYKDTFDMLSDEDAGKLLKRMYKFYFNGEDKKTDNILVETLFSQIRYTMQKSIIGKTTGGIRKQKGTSYGTYDGTSYDAYNGTYEGTSTKDKDKDKDKDKVKVKDKDKDKDKINNNISKNIEQSSEIVKSEIVKVDKRDIEIDLIIETLKECNMGIVDDTIKEQRRYGKLIKDKMSKIKGFDGRYKEFILMLYNNSDEYRKCHFRSLKKFYYEMANIINGIKIKSEKKSNMVIC